MCEQWSSHRTVRRLLRNVSMKWSTGLRAFLWVSLFDTCFFLLFWRFNSTRTFVFVSFLFPPFLFGCACIVLGCLERLLFTISNTCEFTAALFTFDFFFVICLAYYLVHSFFLVSRFFFKFRSRANLKKCNSFPSWRFSFWRGGSWRAAPPPNRRLQTK